MKKITKSILTLLLLFTLPSNSVSAKNYDFARNQQELDLLYAIVMIESGTVEEGNQAVASTILNRVNDDRFPNTITDVITQPYQFSSYGHDVSWQYMNGNVPQSVKDNVDLVLKNGPIHNLHFFWAEWYYNQSGRWDAEAVNYGGNVFFEF